MRVRMFKAQFAPLVRSGAKRQTIRPVPKGRRPQAGDLESWREWSGKPYRSKTVELAQVRVIAVNKIEIFRDGPEPSDYQILSDFNVSPALPKLADEFAQADGFKDMNEMLAWFDAQHGLPFKGILIRAENLTAENAENAENAK